MILVHNAFIISVKLYKSLQLYVTCVCFAIYWLLLPGDLPKSKFMSLSGALLLSLLAGAKWVLSFDAYTSKILVDCAQIISRRSMHHEAWLFLRQLHNPFELHLNFPSDKWGNFIFARSLQRMQKNSRQPSLFMFCSCQFFKGDLAACITKWSEITLLVLVWEMFPKRESVPELLASPVNYLIRHFFKKNNRSH